MTTRVTCHTPPTLPWVGGVFIPVLLVMAGLSGCDRGGPAPAPAVVAANDSKVSENVLRLRVRPRGESPVVSFTFPEPLNDYRGEAKEVSGELTMDASMTAASLRGFVEVKTASVTLGEPEIDGNAHSAMFMNVEKYPVSRFEITGIEGGEGVSLLDSDKAEVKMRGSFSLKGIAVPIVVPSTLTLRRAAYGGESAVVLGATWEINILTPFEIPGPSTGEAAERVLLRAELVLEPVTQGKR